MIPALIWKVLSWIWYTFISTAEQPKEDTPTTEGAASSSKCPISGVTETEKTKCPGAATQTTKSEADEPVVAAKTASTVTQRQKSAAATNETATTEECTTGK